MNKKSIKNLSLKELGEFLVKHKQPKFRIKQLLHWLYNTDVDNFNLMTDLPKSLIQVLADNFVITCITCNNVYISKDGTKKYLFEVYNNESDNHSKSYIETVGIPSTNENSQQLTVCVSTQIGCPMKCKFCATGKQGITRNLSVGEILEQVLFVSKNFGKRVSNIVVMGQGEPFLNYENLIDSLSIINNPNYLNIGARKITVSTCGLIPQIEKFSSVDKQYGLAISLHSAIQNTRDIIMPGVKNFTLNNLKKSLINYIEKTNRRITFEYLMLKDFNDSDKHLKALCDYCNGLLCHVNIIPYNEINNSSFKTSNMKIINKWIEELNKEGIEATIRKSRGSDIDAACGQLIYKINSDVSRET